MTSRRDSKSSDATPRSVKPLKKASSAQRLASTGSEVTPRAKRRKQVKPSDAASSMLVSIDRAQLPSQQNLMSGSAMRVTKKRPGEKAGRRSLERGEKGRGEKKLAEDAMIVRVARKKLAGPMGAKVKHAPPPIFPPAQTAEGSGFMMMAAPTPPDLARETSTYTHTLSTVFTV